MAVNLRDQLQTYLETFSSLVNAQDFRFTNVIICFTESWGTRIELHFNNRATAVFPEFRGTGPEEFRNFLAREFENRVKDRVQGLYVDSIYVPDPDLLRLIGEHVTDILNQGQMY